jgi:Glu-tRNA(Gln) amidotransferase subunit E-like FAD-binding protein
MEKGHLRCDANVSVRLRGAEKFGTKAEVKNLNSFRFLKMALDHEISRQIALIESGGKVVQETRLYNPDTGETVSMRSKEHAHDYRYFPEPDLLPLIVNDEWKNRVRGAMPELPASRRKRFLEDYGLREYDAQVLTATRAMSEYFESVVVASGDARAAANWVMGDLAALLKEENKEIEDSPISAAHLGQLIKLIGEGKLSGKLAKEVLPKMAAANEAPDVIMKREGLESISDEGALLKIVDEVIAANPKQVEQYKSGKQQVIGFLVGQVMKASRGQADPGVVNKLLKEYPAFFVLAFFVSAPNLHKRLARPGIVVFFSVFGLFVWWLSRAQKVALLQSGLNISNYRRTLFVPFADIKEVRQRYLDMGLLRIGFQTKTTFGKSVLFIPRTRFLLPWQKHPILIELRERIQSANQPGIT